MDTIIIKNVIDDSGEIDIDGSLISRYDYEVTLKDIPLGTRDLKVWLPYLPETPYQIIEDVRIDQDRYEVDDVESAGSRIPQFAV